MAQHYDAISIHAPRTGSDAFARVSRKDSAQFQSTLPARGATGKRDVIRRALEISIHAPRTGSDGRECRFPRKSRHFNPRSPHGERQHSGRCWTRWASISIHAPRTGSDRPCDPDVRIRQISIHAPRTGSDPHEFTANRFFHVISIHAPRTGSDRSPPAGCARREAFQSTLPARGATRSGASLPAHKRYFNPRSPHGERQSTSRRFPSG